MTSVPTYFRCARPKLADENVARLLDVLRYWATVNDSASTSARLPWAEAFNFMPLHPSPPPSISFHPFPPPSI